jgi:ankyrin repeat protein
VAQDKAIADCRSALFLTDPEIDRATLITAKGNRVPGTCEWIQEEPQYQQWLEGNTPLLWICGGPGKGKTMLSVYLVEELKKAQPVMSYFCTNEDARRNKSLAVLRSLLWQMTSIIPDLGHHFLNHLGAGESDAAKRIEASLSSAETLWMTFITMCRDARVAQLAFILDGLDECDRTSRDWLASKLYDLHKEPDAQDSHPPKILIISRDILRLRLCSKIRLDPDHDGEIGQDVRSFVSARVQELCDLVGFEARHRRHVERTLLERSEGTFLWVGFAIAELQTKRTVLEVEQCLRDMPVGLPAFYGRMLRHIDAKHTEDVAKILQWTVLSARPLSLSELAEATHCKATRLRSAEDVVRDLVTICHPFLVVQSHAGSQESTSPEHLLVELETHSAREKKVTDERQTVNLIHQSARDFMDSSEMPAVFRFQHENVHFEMAWRCLDLIQRSAAWFTDSREMSLAFLLRRKKARLAMEKRCMHMADSSAKAGTETPMLGYAVEHWPVHARSASSLAKSLLKHPSGFFGESSIVRTWWVYQEDQRRNYARFPDHSDSLGLSAYIGFVPWVEKVIAGRLWRKKINKQVHFLDKSPLEYAAGQGHGRVMKILLEHGADGRHGRYGRSAIQNFAASGNEMAVRICIDHGMYLGPDGVNNDTPLRLAAANGHQTVVQLLLAAGSHCDETRHQKTTALMWAGKRGHGAVVQVLLESGAEVELRDVQGPSAMYLAAAEGHNHIVKMLSDRGASLDGATALWLAASQGNGTEVRLQLDRGVPVDAIIPIPNSVTALYCAAFGGHSDVVRLLIDRGANIEAIAKASDFARGTTIMHVITSRFGMHERFGRVVQLCCNAGADVNAVDHTGCTPLLLAVKNTGSWYWRYGRFPLQALLDHGANIDAEDEDGLTALHHAARESLDTAVIAILLAHGAQINARDRRGRTPLHLAARHNSRLKLDVTQLLLDHGAEINARDSQGLTPLDRAPRDNVFCTTRGMLIGLGAVEGCSIGALDAGSTDSRLGRS